jgi:hypothetical protein
MTRVTVVGAILVVALVLITLFAIQALTKQTVPIRRRVNCSFPVPG